MWRMHHDYKTLNPQGPARAAYGRVVCVAGNCVDTTRRCRQVFEDMAGLWEHLTRFEASEGWTWDERTQQHLKWGAPPGEEHRQRRYPKSTTAR